ncbi:hypothetical protein CEW46_32345 [Bacillus cereus]|nr:hypothetical protein CEW46_32345 [Bacillus cereus]
MAEVTREDMLTELEFERTDEWTEQCTTVVRLDNPTHFVQIYYHEEAEDEFTIHSRAHGYTSSAQFIRSFKF